MRKDSRAFVDELFARVCAIVVDTVRLPPAMLPLRTETPLLGAGVGLDSIDALRLVAALEEGFDITIDDSELSPATFERVGSLVSLVHRLKNGA